MSAPVLVAPTPVVASSREAVRVHVSATPDVRHGVVDSLRRAGVALADEPGSGPDTVVLAAARTVDQALDACHPGYRPGRDRLLVVADTFDPAGVLRAVELGASAMVQPVAAPPDRLAAAVHSARHGDGRMPHQVLIRLLGVRSAAAPPASQRLTARQTAVLALMADGHGNSAIARALCCSEHTVKNVIYELTARLHVRNRAHAVAHAVKVGLI